MSESSVILKAEGIHKSYRMGATRVNVLKGVDLAVQRGDFVAIVGASGSGKSTLLHLLGGLDRPDKGLIRFNGRDVNRLRAHELNRYRNETVGFVFQFYHLLDELSVLENVFLPAMVSRSVVGWLMTRGGTRRRAEELLLADEPTGNLDSATGNGILKVFEELNKAGQTIVMVTHDERIARRAQRIMTLADGRMET